MGQEPTIILIMKFMNVGIIVISMMVVGAHSALGLQAAAETPASSCAALPVIASAPPMPSVLPIQILANTHQHFFYTC